MKRYDYIIIGAGCAGLSLLMRLMDDPGFSSKTVLVIDKDKKDQNDRTWCFWEKGRGYFEDIVYKHWSDLVVKNGVASLSLNLKNYLYKMIRGIDFYNYCFQRMNVYSNIEHRVEEVNAVSNNNGHVIITTNTGTIELKAGFVFNSIFSKPGITNGEHYLLQHFKGWMIKTKSNSFNPGQAWLMDFGVDQKNYPVAFAYVLPVSATQALVEYTVFSDTVLPQEEYDIQLKKYIRHELNLQEYSVDHMEFGVIPMTNHRFSFFKNGIFNIGSAGGQTKPSTGYTFQFIQKQAQYLASTIIKGGKIKPAGTLGPSRFHLYDSILLNVLSKKKMKGADIFTRLFQRIPAWMVFKFLDNETSFAEEIKILRAMPPGIFSPAAIREIWNLKI